MTALIGYLRAARLIEQAEPRTDTRLGATLGKAADEALRAADILRRLRDFYIGRGPKSENFDVRELIDGMLEEFSRRPADKRMTIHHEHAKELPLVYADRIYVEIVLSNLLNNAVEALQDREHPNIHVRTEIEPTRVVISVDDNGPGIALEGAMIFKPFYTSKAEGMGLGLAMSRSLAESLGGSLRSASSLLGGARFELRLPIANLETTAM
jgi:C4-dicarboxylate-specific signal transduction histidine kinase